MARPFILTAEVRVRANRSSIAQAAAQIKRGLSGVASTAGGVSATGAASASGAVARGGGGAAVAAARGATQAAAATHKWSSSQARLNKNMGMSTRMISTTIRDIATLTGGLITLRAAMMSVGSGVSNFLKFEQQMIAIKQITGQTGVEVDKLSTKIRDLAKQYNFAGEILAKSSAELLQSGMGMDTVSSMLPLLSKLGKNAQVGADGLDSVTQSMIVLNKTFGIAGNEMEQMYEKIVKLAKTQYITVPEISQVISISGGQFEALGGDIEELISIAAALKTASGRPAGYVGNALNTIMSRMTESKRAGRLKEEYGVDVFDKNGKFRGLTDVFKESLTAFEETGKGSQLAIELTDIFGGIRRKGAATSAITSIGQAEQNMKNISGPIHELDKDYQIAAASMNDAIAGVKEGFNDLFRTMLTGPFGSFVTQVMRMTEALLESRGAMSSLVMTMMLAGGRAGFMSTMGGKKGSIAAIGRAMTPQNGVFRGGFGHKSKLPPVGMTAAQYGRRRGIAMAGKRVKRFAGSSAGAGLAAMGGMALMGYGSDMEPSSVAGAVGKSATTGAGVGLMAFAMGLSPATAAIVGLGSAAMGASENIEAAFNKGFADRVDTMLTNADNAKGKNASKLMGAVIDEVRKQYETTRPNYFEGPNSSLSGEYRLMAHRLTPSSWFDGQSGDLALGKGNLRAMEKDQLPVLRPILDRYLAQYRKDPERFKNLGKGSVDQLNFLAKIVQALEHGRWITKFDKGFGELLGVFEKGTADLKNTFNEIIRVGQSSSMTSGVVRATDRIRRNTVRDPFARRGLVDAMDLEHGTAGMNAAIRSLPINRQQQEYGVNASYALRSLDELFKREFETSDMDGMDPTGFATKIQSMLINDGVNDGMAKEIAKALAAMSSDQLKQQLESGTLTDTAAAEIKKYLDSLKGLAEGADAARDKLDTLRVSAFNAAQQQQSALNSAAGVRDIATRAMTAVNGGSIDPLRANQVIEAAAGGNAFDLKGKLAALELQDQTDPKVQAEIDSVIQKLQSLGDVAARTADIMNRIGEVQGSINARSSLKEKWIFSEGKERVQLMRDSRMADFAARRGTLQGLSEEQVKSALSGLNNSQDILWRGGGRFGSDATKSYGDIKQQLLAEFGSKDPNQIEDQKSVLELQREYNKLAADAMLAWQTVATRWENVADKLEAAIQGRPQPVPGAPIDGGAAAGIGAGVPAVPGAGVPAMPGAGALGSPVVPAWAHGAGVPHLAKKNAEAQEPEWLAGFSDDMKSFNENMNKFTDGVNIFADGAKASKQTFSQFKEGSLPQGYDKMNTSEKHNALEAMGFADYKQRAAYMRYFKRVEANWPDVGPAAAQMGL